MPLERIILFASLMVLTSCHSGLSSSNKDPNPNLPKPPVIQDTAGCATFNSNGWCSNNLADSSKYSKLCLGYVLVEGDQMFSAIQLFSKNTSDQTCIAAVGTWKIITSNNCNASVSRQYFTIDNILADVVECRDVSGHLISIKGSLGDNLFQGTGP